MVDCEIQRFGDNGHGMVQVSDTSIQRGGLYFDLFDVFSDVKPAMIYTASVVKL